MTQKEDTEFVRKIERRVRKDTRINESFSKGDKLIIVSGPCGVLVDSITKGLPLEKKYVKRVPVKVAKGWKLVVPNSLDDECVEFISDFINGKVKKKIKEIRLLRKVSDLELARFCKIKKIDFKPLKKDNNVYNMIKNIDDKHSETMFSISKSYEEFRKVLSK